MLYCTVLYFGTCSLNRDWKLGVLSALLCRTVQYSVHPVYCIVLYCTMCTVLYCIVLYCTMCTVLYCIVLYCTMCTVLYSTVQLNPTGQSIAVAVSNSLNGDYRTSPAYPTSLYCEVLHCTVQYCNVLYCMLLYCTVLYCTVLYCTVLSCTVLYCTVLYCTVQYILYS